MANLYGLIPISSHNSNSINQGTSKLKIDNFFVELSSDINYLFKKDCINFQDLFCEYYLDMQIMNENNVRTLT